MEIRTPSTSASRASTYNPARWFLGPGDLRRGCSYSRTRDSHLAFCLGVALSCSAGSHSRQLNVGRAKLPASSLETTPGSHSGHTQGSARPSWAPAWPSKSGSLWLQRKRKKLGTETDAEGTGLPQKQSPIFPPELNNGDPEPSHSAETRTLLPISNIYIFLLLGKMYFQK